MQMVFLSNFSRHLPLHVEASAFFWTLQQIYEQQAEKHNQKWSPQVLRDICSSPRKPYLTPVLNGYIKG